MRNKQIKLEFAAEGTTKEIIEHLKEFTKKLEGGCDDCHGYGGLYRFDFFTEGS